MTCDVNRAMTQCNVWHQAGQPHSYKMSVTNRAKTHSTSTEPWLNAMCDVWVKYPYSGSIYMCDNHRAKTHIRAVSRIEPWLIWHQQSQDSYKMHDINRAKTKCDVWHQAGQPHSCKMSVTNRAKTHSTSTVPRLSVMCDIKRANHISKRTFDVFPNIHPNPHTNPKTRFWNLQF